MLNKSTTKAPSSIDGLEAHPLMLRPLAALIEAKASLQTAEIVLAAALETLASKKARHVAAQASRVDLETATKAAVDALHAEAMAAVDAGDDTLAREKLEAKASRERTGMAGAEQALERALHAALVEAQAAADQAAAKKAVADKQVKAARVEILDLRIDLCGEQLLETIALRVAEGGTRDYLGDFVANIDILSGMSRAFRDANGMQSRSQVHGTHQYEMWVNRRLSRGEMPVAPI